MNKFLALLLLTQLFIAEEHHNENVNENYRRCASKAGETCVWCWDGYLGPNGQCVESDTQIDNCIKYVTNGRCEVCRDGYYVDSTKNYECVSIDKENCLKVNRFNQCVLCVKGIRIQNGICDDENECEIEGCDYCGVDINGLEKCALCRRDYGILMQEDGRTTCVEQSNDYRGCKYVNNNGVCEFCNYGYYIQDGKCWDKNRRNSSFIQIITIALAVLFF